MMPVLILLLIKKILVCEIKMELYKLKENLFMYFNENTASVTPVGMHISGSRACMTIGKVSTQMLHPVLLSSGWTRTVGS